MRNVYKFLRASILILILVGGTYFIAQEYSAGIENAVNTSAGWLRSKGRELPGLFRKDSFLPKV